jgi:hypothetical protein
LSLREKVRDRLPRAFFVGKVLDALQAASPVHSCQRGHDPPQMLEFARTQQFASPAKKTLAKKWETRDLGHRIRPSLPGFQPGWLEQPQRMTDPFSWQDQSRPTPTLALLA